MDREAREKKKAWKLEQKKQAQSAFPLPDLDIERLFDYLDREIARNGCDHTHRKTRAWAESNGHSEVILIDWVCENGGYCDCEALANTYDHFVQNRR